MKAARRAAGMPKVGSVQRVGSRYGFDNKAFLSGLRRPGRRSGANRAKACAASRAAWIQIGLVTACSEPDRAL